MYYIVDYNKKCKQNSSWKFCSIFFYSRLSKKPFFLYTPSYRQQGVWSLSLNNDCKYFLLIAHEMTMVWNSTSNKHNSRSNKKFMTQRILLWCSMSSILFLRRQNNIMKKITFVIILNQDHFYKPKSSLFLIKKTPFNSNASALYPYIFLQSLVYIMYLVKQNKKT